MENKVCIKCELEKSVNDFYKRKNGFYSYCKSCHNELNKKYNINRDIEKKRSDELARYHKNKHKYKERTKKYYEKNSQKLIDYQKKYREENPEKIKSRSKKYREENIEKVKLRAKVYCEQNVEKLKQYRQNNLEKRRERSKIYREENPEKLKSYSKKYREENPEKIKDSHKSWREKNKEKIRERVNLRFSSDINFKLAHTLRTRTKDYIKKKKGIKSGKTSELVGCSWSELRYYLESKFKEGMTWENHSFYGWHIDHIKPLASFDLTDPEQQKQAFHYTNLQPLWWRENLEKGAKWQNTTSE
jgi:hypothetical protein